MGVIYIDSFRFKAPVVTPSGITVENVATSNLSISNRTSHSYTYDFVSTTQDGTVGLLICFLGDDGDEIRTVDASTTLIGESTFSDGAGILMAFYEPTQTDLNNGSRQFTFTTAASEAYQFVIIEMSGVDLSDPFANFTYDGSNADRMSVGPSSLTTTSANSLLVSVAGSDDSPTTTTISMTTANGFTEVASITPVTALPGFMVTTKIAETPGTHDTPIFGLNETNELVVASVVINAV